MNLLKETKRELKEHNLTLRDVEWVGTDEVEIPLNVFVALANKEYDSSFGSQSVATDIVVCGSGWWLERHEYDGSEWWEFKEQKKRPSRVVIPRVVVGDEYMWCTLKEMNHPSGKYSSEPFDWEEMEVQDG